MKKIITMFCLLILTPALSFSADAKKDTSKKTPTKTQTTKATSPQKSNDKLLAKIGTYEIRQSNLDFLMAQIPEQYKEQFLQQGEDAIIERLINAEILFVAAKDAKVDKKSQVQEKIKLATRDLIVAEYVQELQKKAGVSLLESTTYYADNKERFREPMQLSASHILVKTEEEATAILDELKKDPSKFEEIAKTKSTCPSGKEGGSLGWFSQGQMVKEFEEATVALKKDEISPVVKTQFGFHIIRLNDTKEEKIKSYDEVKKDIEQEIKMMKTQDIVKQEIENLRKKYKVEKFK